MDFTNYNGKKFNNLRQKERTMNYNQESWGERDELPTVDPIGDTVKQTLNKCIIISENPCAKIALTPNYSQITYLKFYNKAPTIQSENQCTHPNKYKNIISANMKFWVCPDCKEDLGDV